MLSTRFQIPVVSVETETSNWAFSGPCSISHPFLVQEHSTKQHVSLSPPYTFHSLIKYRNYKPLEWLFWLFLENKQRLGKEGSGGTNPKHCTFQASFINYISFQIMFYATASKNIHQNCFHCYCLRNHIFSKKPASVCVFPKWQDMASCWFLRGIFCKRDKSLGAMLNASFFAAQSHTHTHFPTRLGNSRNLGPPWDLLQGGNK